VEEGDHALFEGSVSRTVADIRAAGGEAVPIACDVSERENCVAAVEEVRRALGPIDVLVNNAALTYFLPVADFPASKWHRSFAVNFHAPFYLSQLALEDMLPRKSGAIVNISSGAAIGPGRAPYGDARQRMIGGTLYGAEKAALERFTQGLAAEVYDAGVSVTCLSPSQVVATPGTVHHRLVEGIDDPRGEPIEHMARATLLLATEPLEKVSGRVTYSQQILAEFGWIDGPKGLGTDAPGSGYAQI
jgi:NAD(P)-dependent dehydrogenase (short-subunit alcohol dehydrogenase family)